METEYDTAGNTVICNANEPGTYCLLDMGKWLESIGYTVSASPSGLAASPYVISASAVVKEDLDTKTTVNFVEFDEASGLQFYNTENCGFICEWDELNDTRAY